MGLQTRLGTMIRYTGESGKKTIGDNPRLKKDDGEKRRFLKCHSCLTNFLNKSLAYRMIIIIITRRSKAKYTLTFMSKLLLYECENYYLMSSYRTQLMLISLCNYNSAICINIDESRHYDGWIIVMVLAVGLCVRENNVFVIIINALRKWNAQCVATS